MAFDHAAVEDVFTRVESHALSLGLFDDVNRHEPKSKPANGLFAAIWVDALRPAHSSGTSSTSIVVSLRVRIYHKAFDLPLDLIDPAVLSATAVLLDEWTGDLDLGGTARAIDLLGMEGEALSAQAGYLTLANTVYRAFTITLPVVINDAFTQMTTGE
jgi:hypothetical protein